MPIQKILEIKNNDWLKGISAQTNIPIGGLFQYLVNCDPFEQGGLALPSLSPDNQSLGTIPQFITSWYDNTNDRLYAHTPTKLYSVLKNSPYTVTDVTNQINQGAMTGNLNCIGGVAVWKNRYVYASITDNNDLYINNNTIGVQSGNDILLNHVANYNLNFTPFEIGADGNLYYGMDGAVGVLTAIDTASGNSTTHLIDSGYRVRALVNDGRYLIILADNNQAFVANKRTGDYKCKIYFWDMVQTDANNRIIADVIWDLKDSYMIGAKFLENAVYFFTYSGFFVCNVSTSPKLIRNYPPTIIPGIYGRPLHNGQITAHKGSIYWLDAADTIDGYVYAYGNPVTGQPKIFYIPYVYVSSSYVNACIASSGDQFIVGTSQPGLFFFNVGSTRGNVVVKTIDTNMISQFKYEYIKVVLGQKLSSGQSVQVIATGAGGTQTISSETKSYNSANPKQELKFTRNVNGGSNNPEKFEDITVIVNSNGAPIQRVSVYATPLDDSNEDL